MGLSPADLTIAEARLEMAAGRLTAVALTEAVLARIGERNAELNAYLEVDADGALEQARAADARPDPPPLNGIPICVKDVIDVAGTPTTAGSAGWTRSPPWDAPAVARLRQAGAVIVGKGHTNEFAYGVDGLNPHRGDCRNPFDASRVSGGSSSGPAVATATGMALAGLGTDTSGSLRVPASLCGIVGIRPTLELVPRAGVVPLAWSYDTVGPLARTVEDAAILLGALSGRDESAELDAGAGGLRLGVVDELMDAAEPYVAEGIARVAEELGAEIVPLRFERLRHANAMHLLVQQAEAARVHAPWFRSQRNRYAEPVRRRLEAGHLIPASAYLAAQQARRLLVEEVARRMEDVDAMLAPSTPLVAPRRDAAEVTLRGESVPLRVALLACVVPTSQLGSPAVSVPAGTRDGLPYGIQIVGRPFAEPLVLRIAAACERVAQVPEATGSGSRSGAAGARTAGRSSK
jgi:aspartyl-tRNA(Asn)/glutamyl-tRNA(Gln) amidotransferase subunit A